MAMTSITSQRERRPKTAVVSTEAPPAHVEESGSGNALQANTGDCIGETVSIWQKHTQRRLTREDGREILENMTGFFRVLQEWERAERARDAVAARRKA